MPNTQIKLEVIECRDAVEFITKISAILTKPNAPDFQNPWAYRGHGDAGWALQPAGWRPDGQRKLEPLRIWLKPEIELRFARLTNFGDGPPNRNNQKDFALWYATELVAIRQFCDIADDIGLVIPDADKFPTLSEIPDVAFNCVPGIMRQATHLPDFPFAFAQHHGIPTGLLDWTRAPLNAAYFAVESQPQGPISNSICVWGVTPLKGEIGQLEWITVPRGHHPFVHAQDSLFSYDGMASLYYVRNGRWPTFQEAQHAPGDLVLKKWTLPTTESDRLRQELFARGISRARLMPTLDNVARTTISRWNWY
jgi:hypothetical protein